mgnify:CR=1 FL=1
MHQSAKEGNIEDLEFYLDNLRFDKNPESRIRDGHNGQKNPGLTPMHLAAENGHLELVQLIQYKTDVVNPANCKGWSILHSAALNGQLEIIQEISKELEDKNPAAKGQEISKENNGVFNSNHEKKSIHFKKTVARILFLSKLWYFSYFKKGALIFLIQSLIKCY